MTKPVLNLTGEPKDRGRAHGEILSREIDQNLDRYLKRFQLLGFEKDALMAESATWAEALVLRGDAYRKNGDFVRALADLDEAARLDPGSVDAYVNRALTNAALGRDGDALADLTRATELGFNRYLLRAMLDEVRRER